MVVGALAAALVAVACTAGHAGLGRKACPYLRPRLLRLDEARRNGSNLDLSAVDEDIGLYVRSQLPAGGKATRDQALVRFSAALDRYVRRPGPATGADLTAAEAAVKRECRVGSEGTAEPSPRGLSPSWSGTAESTVQVRRLRAFPTANPACRPGRISSVAALGMVPDGSSDETLLAAIALGDAEAGVAFVRRYQRRVFGLALSMVGDPSLAEDIAQEALLRAWRHAAVYDTRRGSVAAWVLTITRNLAIDALRLKRATPTDPDDFFNLGLAATDGDPDQSALDAEVASRLRQALIRLPVEQRRAVVLASFYGLTAKEVGVRESIPLGTAKTRIRTGLLRLRAVLVAEEATP